MDANSGRSLISVSGSSRVLRFRRMSTLTQRGSSGVDFASWYLLFGSNCVASGYGRLATSAMPATPGSGQDEW